MPSVPLALSSLRDRAAPVDSTYSRISPRFWYDGVSRDLCKMVRSSLGSSSASVDPLSNTCATVACRGGRTPRCHPPFSFSWLALVGRSISGQKGPSVPYERVLYIYIPRASERTNGHLPTQMFRNSFILRNSCSESDNVVAHCTTKQLHGLSASIVALRFKSRTPLFCELVPSRKVDVKRIVSIRKVISYVNRCIICYSTA